MKKFLPVLIAAVLLTACTEGTETVGEAASVTSETSETTSAETTSAPAPAESPEEILARGQAFAEGFAEMSWNYLCGEAWDDYVGTPYFDFEDKSEDNYFEWEGIPFYKLLITDYTYEELMEYIKSFCTDETFQSIVDTHMDGFILGRDNCIYVNGNEPTFIYERRNNRARIIGYTENADGTVTYNCFAETTEKDHDDDLYFSFTLNEEGKLCGEDLKDFYPSELELFSEKHYPVESVPEEENE